MTTPISKRSLLPLLALLSLAAGCTSFKQDAHEVLVRDPQVGRYGDPAPAAGHAKRHWEFAAMSENAYQEGRAAAAAERQRFQRVLTYDNALTKEGFEAACQDERRALPLPGWRRWEFLSADLQQRMLHEGMYLEVLEREADPHTIAVVFEGTNFSELPDWKANLRWFLRFIPGFKDQYTLVAADVAAEFLAEVERRSERYRLSPSEGAAGGLRLAASGKPIRIVATGHSLGGGLAQHFAYVFKQREALQPSGPKVAEVFAFDPSPVTGWFSAPDPPRSYNAAGLVVNRMFEHGEVLAYLRLLTSRFAVSAANPAIWEYRYNFDARTNLIRNHSMRRLACGLAMAAEPWR